MELKYIYKYDSVKALCDFIENTPNNKKKTCNSSNKKDSKFSGTESLEEAIHLLKYGDPKLLKQIQKAATTTTKQAQTQRRSGMELFKSYLGFMPNVGAVLTGDPVNMYNVRQTLTKSTKVVNIIYDISTPYSTSAEKIQAAATKLFKYIYDIEMKGYRVNLYSCVLSSFNKSNGLFCLKIKSSNEHFDALRTAFPLCHPSFLRRIFFALVERSKIPAKDCYGYGRAYHIIYGSKQAEDLIHSQFPNYNYYNIDTVDNAK